jgi:hypothetical protein
VSLFYKNVRLKNKLVHKLKVAYNNHIGRFDAQDALKGKFLTPLAHNPNHNTLKGAQPS